MLGHYRRISGRLVLYDLILYVVFFLQCSLQRLIQHELIFRLLLKVTVDWPRECNLYTIYAGTLLTEDPPPPPHQQSTVNNQLYLYLVIAQLQLSMSQMSLVFHSCLD